MRNVSVYAFPDREYKTPLILKVDGVLVRLDPSDSRIQNARVDDLVFHKDAVIDLSSSQAHVRREFEKALTFEYEGVNVSTKVSGHIDALVKWPWAEGLDEEFTRSFYRKNSADEFRVRFTKLGAEIEEKIATKTHYAYFRRPMEESPDGMRMIGGETYGETVVDEFKTTTKMAPVEEAEDFIRNNSRLSKDFELPSDLKLAWKLGSEEAISEWRNALAEIAWPKVKQQLDERSVAASEPFFHSESFKGNVIYLTEDDVMAHLQKRH